MRKSCSKLYLLGMLILLSVGLAACGNKQSVTSSDSGYNRSISKGLDEVAENKFTKALTYFDNALTQKPKDKKAQAYRDQTKAYVTTQSQLQAGEVQKAVTTITNGTKIDDGAKSLADKLSELEQTAKADLTRYKRLDKAVTAQLAVTDGNYSTSIINQCKKIDWEKQPYLKKLKTKVDKLLKQASQDETTSSISSSSSSNSSSVSEAESAADKKQAEGMRQSIVQSDPDSWDSTELAKVPDAVILAAEKQTEAAGGDVGSSANVIAKQYPNIKKNQSAASDSSDNSDTSNTDDHARAESLRNMLVSNQEFSASVLAGISDSKILEVARSTGTATNSDIAEMGAILLSEYPNLK